MSLQTSQNFLPILELSRGNTTESVHYGAIAVANSRGNLFASFGDPNAVSFLRSSAKPIQLLPFIENEGAEVYSLTQEEIALMCASHSGTDEHVQILQSLHSKTGITEEHLKCGIHPPIHEDTAFRLKSNGLELNSLRHNCSGKHTAMLAFAKMRNLDLDTYLDVNHPIQIDILNAISDMCHIESGSILHGIDGCSAPNFAIPLINTAVGFARLIDPLPNHEKRSIACKEITTAMMAYPEMVAGPKRFDTRLMRAAKGKIIAKGGAEGYQAIGVAPGVIGRDSPGIGIAIKISDGDLRGRVRPQVVVAILEQLGVLPNLKLDDQIDLGTGKDIYNWRKILVGESRPVFKLSFH